jgi:hypothetical protein
LGDPGPAIFKKLSVVMPASLHQRAKRYAVKTDQTLTELVISQLEQFLDGVERDESQVPPVRGKMNQQRD